MKSIFTVDGHPNFHLPDVIEREALIEEPDERPCRAAGVIVFRLAEQERGSAFDIAKINVIAERCPFNLAGARNNQDHLGLRIVPRGHWMKPGVMTVSDCGHWLGPGEKLRIWTPGRSNSLSHSSPNQPANIQSGSASTNPKRILESPQAQAELRPPEHEPKTENCQA